MADLLDVARIPAGEFLMGAEDGDEDERPVHRTYLDEYAIGTHPVTNEEYSEFIRDTGHPSPTIRNLPQVVSPPLESNFRTMAAAYFWTNGTPPEGREQHPVTLVGYDDARAYCAWLSTKSNRPVRLPTEAEWERAARGGLESRKFPWGDAIDATCAHYLANGESKSQRGTARVGSYAANGFKLHDMAGNVWEWVSDWYGQEYYGRAQYLNPQGPDQGVMRLVRGGAWVNAEPRYLRCAYRHKVPPDTYAYSIGFRIAFSLR
jgi:formylglycine-generating enzyme required for sulfatase activity